MSSFFIGFVTVGLVVVSLFIILIVLMQRASSAGGMGAAMGGGAAESAFGTATDHVLARGTVYAAVAFFLMTFVLYLSYLGKTEKEEEAAALLPDVILEEIIIADPVSSESIPVSLSTEEVVQ